ncbi:MAG: hypothetical protein WBC02_07750, partial [Candidatus Aminicenantaceae bacterium]
PKTYLVESINNIKKKVNTLDRMRNNTKKHITITAKSANTDDPLTSRIGLACKRVLSVKA